MKNLMLNYVKAISAVLLFATLAGCNPKNLNFGLVHNISVKSINTGGITIEGTLPIENPNGFRVKAKNADVTILAGNNEIARVKQNLPIVVPGHSKGEYTVNATISIGAGSVFSLMSVFKSNADINLEGNATISSFLYSRNVNFKQNGVQNYIKPILGQLKL